ncbi:uncharacterized protein P174DRAFT_435711 [Aspergillus novofumigatus IBT 16806]|uniref:Uncharacterized protein n=1 Tax=Aspergillus novofumigatus (strain IBT 16806) TaxID=1392255 RepID=A0A2I1BUC6_ASPN1|nr:uncharacterized protein P174DRAFT_435711 [Aspergillus novofumigatus IBT 16806]PKX89007.1 hypothetical protein P174DRAFT_435711 [Aspergillus novofumigatus IBT 16806]
MAMPSGHYRHVFQMVDVITRVPGIERVEPIEVDKASYFKRPAITSDKLVVVLSDIHNQISAEVEALAVKDLEFDFDKPKPRQGIVSLYAGMMWLSSAARNALLGLPLLQPPCLATFPLVGSGLYEDASAGPEMATSMGRRAVTFVGPSLQTLPTA